MATRWLESDWARIGLGLAGGSVFAISGLIYWYLNKSKANREYSLPTPASPQPPQPPPAKQLTIQIEVCEPFLKTDCTATKDTSIEVC